MKSYIYLFIYASINLFSVCLTTLLVNQIMNKSNQLLYIGEAVQENSLS
jgi:hypothetical protein